jgi:HK97 family phage portal protein
MYMNYTNVLDWTAAYLYKTQPNLRTVVSFLARNAAQCSLQTFTKQSDMSRKRTTESPVTQLLEHPNSRMTKFELISTLVSDLALFDDAYWVVGRDSSTPSGYSINPIPPEWVVGAKYKDLWTPSTWQVQPRLYNNIAVIEIPAENMVHFHGWNPTDPRLGYSAVSALKALLAEQLAGQEYRNKLWVKGPQIAGTLERPVDAPPWDLSAQQRFMQEWNSQFRSDGPAAGGTPLLQDGMTFKEAGNTARDNQYVEAATLAFKTVCSVYHINPAMVGDTDGQSYSSIKEFRTMLYTDTLGPLFAQIEDRINTFVLPMIEEPRGNFVEFNVEEKLQGDFEDQANAMSQAVGGPWLVVNEARALINRPSLGPLYDELITPLNVVRAGGNLASPQDTAPAVVDRTGPGTSQPEQQPKSIQTKADAEPTKLVDELRAFFGRQYSSVASRLGSLEQRSIEKAWDAERWDTELTAIIAPAAKRAALSASLAVLTKHNPDHSGWAEKVQHPYLDALAQGKAVAINAGVKDSYAKALETTDWKTAVKRVGERTGEPEARAIESDAAGFGSQDAAKASGLATKTWGAGSNARPAHAAMGGETVPVDESFSNSQRWPGDAVNGSPEDSDCNCDLTWN